MSGGAYMAASLLTLTSWMELSRLRSTAEAHDNLLVSVNAMDRTHKDPSPSDWSPVPSLLARLGLTFLLGSTLCMCSAWVVMGFGASHWSHLPAYVYQSTVAHLVTVSQVCDFLRLRDVARRLLNLLQQVQYGRRSASKVPKISRQGRVSWLLSTMLEVNIGVDTKGRRRQEFSRGCPLGTRRLVVYKLNFLSCGID
ncbi:uncharacterized protein LOC117645486 [Thrips palmi]|uniref:Uncharacterized protein LOC117645486 n=1 Tax=Thrips palmi TaxID=161013 RepID=A0A6P8Z4V0_THRPL|nr:uncharacterized protein LOC117645486 [Thrips palmi]